MEDNKRRLKINQNKRLTLKKKKGPTALKCTHTDLYNSRITGESMLGFRGLRHSDVFDVTSSEDDVFINFVFGRHRSVCVSVLCSVRFD